MGRIAKNARYSVEARVVETSIRSTERRSIDEPTILLVRMTTSDWGQSATTKFQAHWKLMTEQTWADSTVGRSGY